MMRAGRVTAGDVARRAGVSKAAVSRVFTPGASASDATARKVREAAAALGYHPNMLARSLTTGRSRIVGLVVAYLDNPFYPEAVERLPVALQERGCHVLLFMAAPTVDDVDRVMREILDYQIDGIVLASVNISAPIARECQRHGIPVVMFNREREGDGLNAVVTDNRAGGRAVAEHLVALGHRRIGYVAGFEDASTQRGREAGFREGLAAAGIAPAARGLGNFLEAEARAAALRMFGGPDRPGAVFVCDDHMAFTVMDVLRFELGLRVPADVSVAGFDDVALAARPAYALTTVRQPVGRMVAETVAILLAQMAAPGQAARRAVLDGRLVVRGSTGPPADGDGRPGDGRDAR